jgi:hypothetical protein
MSSEAVSWVWTLRGISAGTRTVLLRLAEHADFRGFCRDEGYAAIAEFCEISERQVMRIVLKTAALGLLSVEKRRGEKSHRQLTNVIRLHVIANVGGAASALSRVTPVSPGCAGDPGDIPGDAHVTRPNFGLGGKGGDSRDTAKNHDVVTSSDNLNQNTLFQPGDTDGTRRTDPGVDYWFDHVFWPRYPRKIAKGRARRAFARMKPTKGLQDAILRAVDRLIDDIKARATAEQFIPYAATWLRDEPWADGPGGPGHSRSPSKLCTCGAAGVVFSRGAWYCRSHDPERIVPRETLRRSP